MTVFKVLEAQADRKLPAKDQWPEKWVDHLTVSANGEQKLVTMFRKLEEPLPAVGSEVDLELGEPDAFTKGRIKARLAGGRRGGGGGRGPTHPEDARRMGRCHSQNMALQLLAIKYPNGLPDDWAGLSVVRELADWFENDIAAKPVVPRSDVPGDTSDLPDPDAVPEDSGIPF